MPKVFIDDVAFTHGLPAQGLADALARVELARADTNQRLAQLRAGIKGHDAFLEKRAATLLIESLDARLASAIAANKKLKPALRQSLERCLAVPKLLDFNKPLPEPVPVYAQKKKSGGVRLIHKPGLLYRTAQHMVRGIVGAHFAPRPFQFTHAGVQKAIQQVKAAVADGKVHVARLDIKDFYPSFEVEKLVHELPLPKEVVEHVVVGRQYEVVVDKESMKGGYAVPSLPHAHDALVLLARQGLPQGSVCSPIVGAYCMSRLKWAPTADVIMVNYADDFALLSSSPALLATAIGVLTDAVADLPGGQFVLKNKAEGTAEGGFEFLGHHLQLVAGKVTTNPTYVAVHDLHEQLDKLETILTKKVLGLGSWKNFNKVEAIKLLAGMVAKIEGWLAAYSECDDPLSEIGFWAGEIADWCNKLSFSKQQLRDAKEPYMGYRWNGYAIRASVHDGGTWLSTGSSDAGHPAAA